MKTEGSVLLTAAFAPKVMTQSELARELHVSPQAVSGWVAGKATPTPALMARIEDLLGIPMRSWTKEAPQGEVEGRLMPFQIKPVEEA
jgi:transcriptional regulator with XRE-family HTH domain